MPKEDPLEDVSDADMTWPDADSTPPVTDTTTEDDKSTDDTAKDDTAKDDKSKWDKDRQKLDEASAQAKKNADAVADLRDSIDSLPDKLQEMVAKMVADKGGGQEPPADNIGDILAQIEALDPDADYSDLADAVKGLAKTMKAGTGNKANIEKALQELRDKDAARDSREAQRNANQRVTDHLRALERKHFSGKGTHRTDIIAGAKEVCAKMGFNQTTNPPSESTGLLAMEIVAERLAAKEKATQDAKDNQVVPDSMSSGRPVNWGDKNLTMEEAVKEMGL